MKFCPQCGNKVEGDKFCNECGHNLTTNDKAQQSQPTTPQSNNKTIFALLGGIIIGLGAYIITNNSDNDNIKSETIIISEESSEKTETIKELSNTTEETQIEVIDEPSKTMQEFNVEIVEIDGFTIMNNTVVSYDGSSTVITIPALATGISADAFIDKNEITKVTIHSGVNYIGNGAFSSTTWYNNLSEKYNVVGDSILIKYIGNESELVIPDNIKQINGNSFSYNTLNSCKSIRLPNSLETIGDFVFANCDSLTSITIPSSVTYIGSAAFKSCTSLTNITIPSTVKTVADAAFGGCSNLKSISILGMDTVLEDDSIYGSYGIFWGCDSLESIYVYRGSAAESYLLNDTNLKNKINYF